MRAKLILVTGLTGAGKTTYCQKLKKEGKGHVFSIDKWMKALYWQDMPSDPDMSWFVENQKWYTDRIKRCEDHIVSELMDLLQLGLNCVLDLGFTAIEHRKRFIDLGSFLKVDVEIHHLDVSSDVRWERVEKRNREKSESFSMNVDRAMFDYMETVFESFTEQERKLLI